MTAFLNANSDVYLGYTGWAAGGFASTYELNEVPTLSSGTWTDQKMVTQCIVGTRTNSTMASAKNATMARDIKPIRAARGVYRY